MTLRILTIGTALGLLTACGGGAGSPTPQQSTSTTVHVLPDVATVASSGSLALTATVVGPADTSVTWTVDGISGGNAATGVLSGSGNNVTYTAPAVAGSHTVLATSNAAPDGFDQAQLTVLAPGAALVTLSPGDTTLASGASLAFNAAVSGSANTALVWYVDGITDGNSSTGTLSATTGGSNTYTAPSAAGTHTVSAVSQADPTVQASSVVSVQAPGTPVVSLNPGDIILASAGTQSFTATVTGNSNTAVTWSLATVSGAAGTLAGSGNTATYTGPASAAVNRITATSAADATRSASATVTVQAPSSVGVQVAVSPASAALGAGQTGSFGATVSGTSNTAVAWSLTNVSGASGSLSAGSGASVTYTAPAAAGSDRITATSQADPGKSASALVTVSAPARVQVSVSPSSASLGSGQSRTFTASVSNTSNTAVAWSVDGIAGGNASVGTLSVSGTSATYTAPTAASNQSHTLKATSQADSTASGTASIAVLAGNTVNVKDYGAAGDGSTNDTSAIQKAINAVAGTGGTVYVPAGTYMISATTSLALGSNMTLSLDSGAVLQAIANSATTYRILNLAGVSSVRVTGGTLVGDRNTRSGSCGDSGVGIQVNGSSDVTVDGTAVRDTCGDGVYLTGSNSNVTFSNMALSNCGRNGFGIVQGSGITLQGCSIAGTHGLDPQLGIDVEPNPGQTVSGLVVNQCTVTGNLGGGIGLGPAIGNYQNAWVTGCTVSNNTVTGNTAFGIAVSACDGNTIAGNSVSGTVRTVQSDGNGIWAQNYATNTNISGNTCTSNGYDGIQLGQCAGSLVSGNTCNNNTHHGINNLSGSGATVTADNTTTGNGINP